MTQGKLARRAILLLLTFSAFGLALSIFNFFWTGNGIHGSIGALIVIGSTALMALSTAAIAFGVVRGWVRIVLAALVFLDILGTGFAAYMLEADVLFGFMVVALVAWLVSAFADVKLPGRAATSEAAI
jgi:quinoprotein glucose dehydrogenase